MRLFLALLQTYGAVMQWTLVERYAWERPYLERMYGVDVVARIQVPPALPGLLPFAVLRYRDGSVLLVARPGEASKGTRNNPHGGTCATAPLHLPALVVKD